MPRSHATAFQRVLSVLTLVVCFFLPLAAHAATDTVTNLNDSGTGSLRATIAAANAGDTIVFQSGLTGTITVASTLTIGENLTIQGPGANVITISGNNAVQIFNISSGTTVAISGLTIANGLGAPGSGGGASFGGGIFNSGTLTVSGVTFSRNDANGNDGGGIANASGCTLTVVNSTFMNNVAGGAGGGIFSEGTLTVVNSTFSGNFSGSGAGIDNLLGTATVSNSTFSGNNAPGGSGAGINNQSATLTVSNSIFTGGTAFNGGGIENNMTANVSNSIFFNNSEVNAGDCRNCTTNANGVFADPKLLPLGNYGGTTQTFLPQTGSSAICAGSNTLVPVGTTTDQRGFPLVTTCVDAGAVQTNYLLVTNTADAIVTTSLRAAIIAANSAGMQDIGFNTTGTITLLSALPALTGQVNIVGPGANQITVSGGGLATVGSVLVVNSSAAAFMYGMTIANGNAVHGGGINNSGTLTVNGVTFSADSVSGGGSEGAGIYNGNTLVVSNSTFTGNSSAFAGAGIYNQSTATVTNSTFSGNSSDQGGGIDNFSGTMAVSDSTFSGNFGGGIVTQLAVLTVSNSIFSGNDTGIFDSGTANPADTANVGNSVFFNNGQDCLNCATNTNEITGNPKLLPLGNYGGGTPTMLPAPGSSAICGGSVALIPSGITTDQRGFARTNSAYTGSACTDAGAVQTNYTSIQFNSSSYSGAVNQAISPAPVVSITENGQNIGGIPVTIGFGSTGTATGLGPVTTVAGTGATFSGLSVDTRGSDQLSAVVTVTPPGSNPSFSLSAANASLTVIGPPAVTVAFSPATILPGGGSTTTMTVTITNPNAITLTGLTISDTLPPGLVLDSAAIPPCGGTPGSLAPNSFTLIGFRLTASANCSIQALLHATTAGIFIDTTSTVPSNEGGTGSAGSATLTVVAPPTITAAFGAPSITYGGVTTLTFTLSNPNTTTALTGAGFSDTLPAGLVLNVASLNLTNTCGGAAGATGSSGLITLSGGTIGTSSSCTLSLNVKGIATGTQNLITSTVATTNGGTGSAATASIMVTPVTLTVTAVSPTIIFGTALPAYTANITGFVNGDPTTVVTGSASLVTSPTTPSAQGTYTITASQGTLAAPNYTFSFVNGLLTINKAATTVTLAQTAPTTAGVGTGVSTTFSATVNDSAAGSTGTPTGSVQFFDGATPIGSGTLSGGVATLTTTFSTVTTHLITAVYSGDGNFTTSTSAQFSEVVATPGFSVSSNPNTLTIARGGNGTATLTLTPAGNYTGTIALSCSGLPAFASCQFLPSTITFTGNNVAQTTQLTVFTLNAHAVAGASASSLLWLPAGMLACFIAMRRRKLGRAVRSLTFLAIVALALAGITGCGSSAVFVTPTGNNTVTISATGTNGAGVTTQTAVITVTITQ